MQIVSLVYKLLAFVGTLALAFSAGWFIRGHYAAQAQQAALAQANADAAAKIATWQRAANRLESNYLREKAKRDAQNQQDLQSINSAPGGDAPLDPYLAHAASVLWP